MCCCLSASTAEENDPPVALLWPHPSLAGLPIPSSVNGLPLPLLPSLLPAHADQLVATLQPGSEAAAAALAAGPGAQQWWRRDA